MDKIFIFFSFWVLLAPPAAGQQGFDAAQLLADVKVLSADSLEGRRAGTRGAARARAYIQRAFQQYGVRPFEQGYAQSFSLPTGPGKAPAGINLLGYLPGSTYPEAYIVVSAHYDHLGVIHGEVYNGADDNASGVAGLLALADFFGRHQPRHSIVFAAFDAEEQGLLGARAFVEHPPVPVRQILLNVNLDMIGRNARNELFATGAYHAPFLKPYLERVAARSKVCLRFGHDAPRGGAGDDWTMSSDHAALHQAGIPYVYFGVEDHEDYHRPSDDYDAIDPAFFTHAVEAVLDAVLELDTHLTAAHPPASH